MFKATIQITRRPSILDPQGKAAQHALANLGYTAFDEVRIGKYIELTIATDDPAEASQMAQSACEKLLANPVMEDFTITLEALAEHPA